MSVCKNEQDEQHLRVLDATAKLVDYTYDRTQKEKANDERGGFPKSARRLANQLWDQAFYADCYISAANDYFVHSKEDYIERRRLQMRARGLLRGFPRTLYLAHRKGYVPDNRLDFWAALTSEACRLLDAWIKADEQRYKNIG